MNIVYKTIPRHTDVKVSLDQVLEVYFMVDLNKNTIKAENVILFNLKEQAVEPIQMSYNRRVLKVTPVKKLMANSHYQLQLVGGDAGLGDITGRVMPESLEVEFMTKDVDSIKPPVIIAPTDVSVVREAVTFRLAEVAEADYYEMQISFSNTFHNLVWPINGEKVHKSVNLAVTPDIAYKTGRYYMRVRSVNLDGETSAWSNPIRFFYDGDPVYTEPIDEVVNEEPVAPVPADPVVVAAQLEPQVILKAVSRFETKSQLTQLQNVFTAKLEEAGAALVVTSSAPKDGTINNNVAKFNNLVAGGNQRKLVVVFSENLDPNSVTNESAYVLSERN